MIFNALVDILVEKTGCERSEITKETRFLDIGIDSLDVTEIMVEMEDKIGDEVELDQKVETVGELVAYIEKRV